MAYLMVKSPYIGYTQSAQLCKLSIHKDLSQDCDSHNFLEYADKHSISVYIPNVCDSIYNEFTGTFPALVKMLADIWYFDDIEIVQELIKQIVVL